LATLGDGFYCADNVRDSLRFVSLSALEEGSGRRRTSVIYFDVKNDDLNDLNETPNWKEMGGTEFTEQCLRGQDDITYAGERSDLQLVKSKLLVRDPHEVEREGMSPEFEDNRKQYAFHEEAENLLLD
jgi:hypothetical protein